MNLEKFALPENLSDCARNIWIDYSDLARKYNPINLGQGAPDYGAPAVLTNALKDVANDDTPMLHQYTRGFGHPRLVNVLSRLYSSLIDREIDPINEIIVSNGAQEALYCAILGFIKKGDEVIIMEPYFDSYEQLIWMAGGTPVYVPLKPNESNEWVIDEAILNEKFNSKTKMIIVNSPHNPTGKVFTRDELELISDLCKRWDVLCLSDEVYEWMIYKPNKFERIVKIPDMWQRTITVGSGGKTFCATGWKIGWAYGPANLIRNLQVIHQNCVYTCCTPLQEGMALAFEQELKLLGTEKSYFVEMMNTLEKKRDFCAKFLSESGLTPMIPQGGYFMLANWKKLESKVDLSKETDEYKDFRFTKWMSKNIKLQVIPISAFYNQLNKRSGEDYVRFCFIKNDETLNKAANILKTWTSK